MVPSTLPSLVSSSLYLPLVPEPGSSSTSTVGVRLLMVLLSPSLLVLPAGSVTSTFISTSVSPGSTGRFTVMPVSISSCVTGRSIITLPSLSVILTVSPTSVLGSSVTVPLTLPSLVSPSLYSPFGPLPGSRVAVTPGVVLSTSLLSEPVPVLPAGLVTSTLSSTSVSPGCTGTPTIMPLSISPWVSS